MDLDGELPEGWVAASLGEVAPSSKERVEPHERPKAPYLSLEHVESNTLKIIGRGSATDVKSTKSVFRAGDVLYGKLRPYLNKVAVPTFDGICSTDFIVFPQRAWLSSQYLMWFLSQPYVVEYADHHSAGVSLPRVKLEALAQLELPLSPLAEQHRIVAKVEELLSQVNATRERLARTAALLKRFRQSVLTAACDGRLTSDWREEPTVNGDLPDEWTPTTLAAITSLITSGSRGWAKFYSGRGPLFIRAQNINSDELCLDDVAHVEPPKSSEGVRTKVARGDVLVTITGANVTKSAVVDKDLGDAYVSQHVALVRLVDPSCCRFVFMWLISPQHGRARLLEDAYGAGKPGLSLDNIRQLTLSLPTAPEQHEIVRRVDALFSLADAIESRVAAATARAERLMQSILAKAFRGELVPTEAELARREGRAYEPAAVLLARIRAGREAEPVKTRRTRKARSG